MDPDSSALFPENLSSMQVAGPDGSPAASFRWIGGDLRCLPFRDQTFDRVFSVAALCFVEDERETVKGCRFLFPAINRKSNRRQSALEWIYQRY